MMTPGGRGRSRCAGSGTTLHGEPMRAMFWTYLILLAGGLVYFSVIGLSHH